jgi:hypothetical protein
MVYVMLIHTICLRYTWHMDRWEKMDHWEKLNFDGLYPLVNHARVILLAFGGHPRRNTRVMELGCQLLTKEK